MRQIVSKLTHYFFTLRWHFNRFQFNFVAIFFISVWLVIGAFFMFSNVFPNVFAANDSKKEWALNSANASQFSYDSSLVTVDDTGAYPISGVNKLLNPSFSSDNSSWDLSVVAGATTPTGWSLVLGNSTFSTNDFLVMKYEAKCASTGAPTVGLTSPTDGTSDVYRDDGAITPSNNCTSANDRQVVSVASGYPIAYIDQTEAATRCGTISVNGEASHLIINNEWMTVARDAEGQDNNWSLGTVGSGYLYAGHNDLSPNHALVASTNDANRAAYTNAGGDTEDLATATHTASGESDMVGNQVRTFNLSNGSVVWDFSGNVYEWTNNIQSSAIDTTDGWVEWNDANVASGARALYGSNSYLSAKGSGKVNGGNLNNGLFRGGNWSSTDVAGVFALYLNDPPSNRSEILGFRCASDPVVSQSFQSSSGRFAAGGNLVTVGSVSDAKIVQNVNVGDTSPYDFSVYVYDNTSGHVGGAISDNGTSSSIAQLWYDGAVITTAYTDVGSGWWKLSGVITGVDDSLEYGVLVKSGKTVVVDEFTLAKQGIYSVYTTDAFSSPQAKSWDSFCEGTLSGSTCTPDATYTGNALIKYQICTDNGSTCESSNSWKYWNGNAWIAASDTVTTVNTATELTQTVMQALPVVSQNISVKAIFSFGGADIPKLLHITIGMTTNSGGNITFNEDTRCLATTPPVPQLASRSSANGGVNLLWSATGGTQVDIEIANDKGEYLYKYTKVPNTGHMFLPNVILSQMIRIRVFNECEYGDWLVASTNNGALSETTQSTVPTTGITEITYAFVISLGLILFGVYLFVYEPRRQALLDFERRVKKDLS